MLSLEEIGLLTLGGIIWYALETYKIRKQSVEQTELQTRPILIMEDKNGGIFLRNIGLGPALNIGVENIVIHVMLDENAYKEIVLQFTPIDLMPPKVSQEITLKVLIDGSEIPEAIRTYKTYLLNNEKKNFEFSILYRNIEGRLYRSLINAGKSGMYIKERSIKGKFRSKVYKIRKDEI